MGTRLEIHAGVYDILFFAKCLPFMHLRYIKCECCLLTAAITHNTRAVGKEPPSEKFQNWQNLSGCA